MASVESIVGHLFTNAVGLVLSLVWRELSPALVFVVVYPTPSEGWGYGGRPWSPRSRATPQGLDQRS